jgi:hypothetical protein
MEGVMKKVLSLLLALLAVPFLLAPAFAQMSTVRPGVVRPDIQKVQPNTIQSQPQFDPANDPERARAVIAKLREKNRQLRQQMGITLADLQALRIQLDEMTRKGGSGVLAQCTSPAESRNTAGASEDCYASGYTCGEVSGQCHRSCTTTNMCAPGFVCDIGAARCVVPSSGD